MKNIINQLANNALRTFLPPCRERRGGSWVGAALLLLAMLAMSPTSAWAQRVLLYIDQDSYEISGSGESRECTMATIRSEVPIYIMYCDDNKDSFYSNSSPITRENCSSVSFSPYSSSSSSTIGTINVDQTGDYTFTVSWDEGENGGVPSNYKVSVTYPEKTYKITLIDDTYETFTSDASDENAVPYGTEVTLTVTPVEGRCFYSLEDNHGTTYYADNVNIDENGVVTLTVTVTEDTEYKVYCNAITYTIAAVPNQSSLGTVSITPKPDDDGTYTYGNDIFLTATPAAGCEFVCWSDGEKTYEGETDAKTGINTLNFNAERNVTYTAIFRGLTSFDVIVKADGAENAAVSAKNTTTITFDYADEVRTLNCYNLDKLSKTLTLEGMVKYDITLSDIVITAPDENVTPDPDGNGTVWAGVKPRRTLRKAPALTRPALVLEGDEGSPYYLDADHTKITLHKTPEGRYVVNDTEVECTVTGIYFYNPHRMTKTDAVAATCTEPGSNAYWYCSDCDKYFTDDAGVNETTPEDQVIAPLGHDFDDDGICTHTGCTTRLVTYLVPVYNTEGDPTSGIESWTTKASEADPVTSSTGKVTWGTDETDSYYYVSGTQTITEGAVCKNNVHLILLDGAKLTVTSQNDTWGAGIEVSGDDNSLTIYAQSVGEQMGVLSATGGLGGGAGIGGRNNTNNDSPFGQNITINGGKVTANGGSSAGTGIGGGHKGSGKNITINGGIVTATGAQQSAAIGGGLNGTGQNITINGGTVTANSIYSAGIGSGYASTTEAKYITINGGTVTANGGNTSAGIGGGREGSASHIYINGGNVTANGGNYAVAIGAGMSGSASNIYINTETPIKGGSPSSLMAFVENNGGDLTSILSDKQNVTVHKHTFVDGVCSLSTCGLKLTHRVPAYCTDAEGKQDAKLGIASWSTPLHTGAVTQVLPTKEAVTWTEGWYYVEGNVTLSKGAVCQGDVHLILCDGATLTANGYMVAGNYYPGIQVSGTNSLTVYAQSEGEQMGALKATGSDFAAGIGGGNDGSGSYITINGGAVTATGGNLAAGIGGGNDGSGSHITINGGAVTATGGAQGAGIGGGASGSGSHITINGGAVTAYNEEYNGNYGAAIGNGFASTTPASAIFISNLCGVEAGTDKGNESLITSSGDFATLLSTMRYVKTHQHAIAGEPTWKWDDDGSDAEIRLHCTKGDQFVLNTTTTPAVSITSEVKTQGSCQVKGIITYHASVAVNNTTYEAPAQDVSAYSHSFGTDGVCTVCGTKQPASVTTSGVTTYYNSFNAAFKAATAASTITLQLGNMAPAESKQFTYYQTFTALSAFTASQTSADITIGSATASDGSSDDDATSAIGTLMDVLNAGARYNVVVANPTLAAMNDVTLTITPKAHSVLNGNKLKNVLYEINERNEDFTLTFDYSNNGYGVVKNGEDEITLNNDATIKLYSDGKGNYVVAPTVAGTVIMVSNDYGLFNGLTRLTSLTFNNFNTAGMTSMWSMFRGCSSLTSLNLSGFNTSRVTVMGQMFQECTSLTSLNLSSFNTSKVEYMNCMFRDCSSLTALDLSSFNTPKLENTASMFQDCTSLQSLTINNFNMENVDAWSFGEMFSDCNKLNSLTLKALPFMREGTFDTQFAGEGKSVCYQLDDNSKVYSNYDNDGLPTPTTAPTYSRQMTDKWGTIVLPFAVKGAPEGFEFYTVRGISADSEVSLTKVGGLVKAGTPMFVRRTGQNTNLTVTAHRNEVNTNIEEPSDLTKLIGTYKNVVLNKTDDPDAYFVYNDKLYSTSKLGDDNHVTIKPFRAYLTTTAINNARQLVFVIDDDATSVEEIENGTSYMVNGTWYNLNGQKLAAPRKGVNIINGKKVMVK